MAKLTVATLERLEEIRRDNLRRGVLNVDLTPRPYPCSAGGQPSFSGHHFSRRAGPFLLQFPVEILKQILTYLEPIWLFQVAAAYVRIHEILDPQSSNRIWYDAVPAALYLEPESFQDEAVVKDRMLAHHAGDETDETLQLSKEPFRVDMFYYDAIQSSRFVVPGISNMSELSLSLDFEIGIAHPKDRRFYPTTPTRIRLMALGGPFQPWLDYRRELAGHLHYGMRCCICFELAGKYCQYKRIWGMIWCIDCYNHYMLSPHHIAEIPGLEKLIRSRFHQSTIQLTKPDDRQYRPMVDEILRAKIGVDYETAAGIQRYIRQLLDTWKGSLQSEPLKANRRRLRRDIVHRAEEIWRKTALKKGEVASGGPAARRKFQVNMAIIHARERWAPTSMLATFLFPARLLTGTSLWLPCDPAARWLEDPTLVLKTTRDVLGVRADWINQEARQMVQNLVANKPGQGVTAWLKAAEEWHIQRLKHDLQSGKYLHLEKGGCRLMELDHFPTATRNRMDVIAKKLRIDPLFPVGALPDHEKEKAVACFNRIVIHRCAGCPLSNQMVVPCGLEAIVRHLEEHHPYAFWLNDKWSIRG